MSTQRAPTTRGWRPQPTVADRLRLLRRDYQEIVGERLTQDAFATLLNISKPVYKQWEAGYRAPPFPVLERIAETTGCDLDWLAGTDPPTGPKRGIRSESARTGKERPSGLWYPGRPAGLGPLWHPHPYTERAGQLADTCSPAFVGNSARFLLSAAQAA